MFFAQDTATPNGGAHGIERDTDPTALKIFWILDALARIDANEAVPKAARH